MLFEEHHYGKLISEELSTVLKRNTGKYDYGAVSELMGVSVSTIRDVTHRAIPITVKSAPAIIELARVAIHAATETRMQAISDEDYLLEEFQFHDEEMAHLQPIEVG